MRWRSRKTCSSKDELVKQECDPNGGCDQICDKIQNKCSCNEGFSLDTRNGEYDEFSIFISTVKEGLKSEEKIIYITSFMKSFFP